MHKRLPGYSCPVLRIPLVVSRRTTQASSAFLVTLFSPAGFCCAIFSALDFIGHLPLSSALWTTVTAHSCSSTGLRFEVYHERQQHCCCSSVTVREERWDQSTHTSPFSPDVYYQLGCMQPKFAETPGCPRREFDQSTESYKLLYSFQMGKGNHNYISSPLNVRD